MKKNISVNIFGTLYPIDEDAYDLLLKYNENMRRYYSRMEDGEEIADDIEHRVAELLSELRSQGVMAITIDHVKQIIERIGDPQDLYDDDIPNDNGQQAYGAGHERQDSRERQENRESTYDNGDSSTGNPRAGVYTGQEDTQATPSRRLFRDPEDKIVGGVMSGLSHFLGIKDPLLLRIILVLLLIMSLTTFGLIYLVAWVLIPEAVTPEDRLRMYGKPVNAKAINEELMRGINNANNFVHNPQHQDAARGCLSVIAKIILFFVGLIAVIVLGSLLLALVTAVTGLSAAALFGGIGITALGTEDREFLTLLTSLPTPMIIIAIICGLIVIGLPLYAVIRMILKHNDPESNLSTTAKVCLILTWVVCLGILIGAFVQGAITIHDKMEVTYRDRHTHNGIYLPENSWNLLQRKGLNAETLEGAKQWITAYDILPNGEEGDYISIDKEYHAKNVNYNLSQEQELRPGIYRIDGYVRADGEGNALYVLTNNMKDTLRIDIPEYVAKTNPITTDSVVIDSNDGSHAWDHVEGTFEVKKQENVKFGISNLRQFNNAPRNGQSISIADIRIGKN